MGARNLWVPSDCDISTLLTQEKEGQTKKASISIDTVMVYKDVTAEKVQNQAWQHGGRTSSAVLRQLLLRYVLCV